MVHTYAYLGVKICLTKTNISFHCSSLCAPFCYDLDSFNRKLMMTELRQKGVENSTTMIHFDDSPYSVRRRNEDSFQ